MMKRRSPLIKQWLLAGAAALAMAAPGVSAAELKPELGVDDRMVTLGDLFYDVGDKADIIVFEAPEPGRTKVISAFELQRLAKKHELDWEKPDYLKRVRLVRSAATITGEEIADLMRERAIADGADPDSQIRFFGRNNGFLVPFDATAADIEFERFSLSERKDRFSAVLLVPSGGDAPARISLNGTIEEVRQIPVFTRSIMPGEIIKASDIEWISFPANRLTGRAVYSQQQLVGMTVKRPTQTDKPINSNDLMAPVAVQKGAAVTMTVRSGLMLLTASGRALEDGGIGDTIRVLNAKSRTTIDAKVVSSSQVEVISAPSLALGPR